MRQPWRGWGVKQLVLFVLETIVLAWLVLLAAGSEGVPDLIRVGARILASVVLLVGFLAVLGWVQGRRSRPGAR